MAVFPEAKLFSGQNFRVKIEIQNSIPEFASRYGMPVGEIGNGIGSGRRLALPAPAPARRHRPATGHGHGQPRHRPPGPATGHARHGRTDRHRHGKAPANVETWQSAGTVAAGIKQKAGNPEGKPATENGRQLSAAVGLGWVAYFMRETVARVPIR